MFETLVPSVSINQLSCILVVCTILKNVILSNLMNIITQVLKRLSVTELMRSHCNTTVAHCKRFTDKIVNVLS